MRAEAESGQHTALRVVIHVSDGDTCGHFADAHQLLLRHAFGAVTGEDPIYAAVTAGQPGRGGVPRMNGCTTTGNPTCRDAHEPAG